MNSSPGVSVQTALQQGWAVHQSKQYGRAEEIYRAVLKHVPNNANAWCYLGMVLHDQRRFEDAVTAYRRALGLQPEFPIALNNLGNSLRYIGEVEQADAAFAEAIRLKPEYVNAYKNRGTLHVWSGRLDEGQRYYEQALRINPQEAELHRNLGVIYLLQGRYAEGWREYRWRWNVGDLHRPSINAPVWDGSDLHGKSILLSAEQGLGDTLNFVRFARVLQQRGARTLVYCQAALVALLQASPDIGAVYPDSLALNQPFDFQCSLLDVADILQLDSNSIPAAVPYLQAAQHLRNYWSQHMGSQSKKFRVGIAWQGNPDHQADVFRSIPLRQFEVLADVPGIELWSLQGGHGREQASQWQGAIPLGSFGEQLDQSSGAFMDTAAIMNNLDLVISSDTSIAHLTGALGVPVWLAVGFVPDWRWLLNRDDTPWYPTMRLFRQPKFGDWGGVFRKMREELQSVAATAGARDPE